MPPIKSLFANISLAVILNLLIKSAWILANNVVQDEIGHNAFGTYAALYALGFLFIAFSDFGLNQYTTKTVASDHSLLKQLFPTLLTLRIGLSIFYPIFMMGVGFILGYDSNELLLLLVLCLTQAFTQVIFFFRANFQAFQKFRLDAFASILDRTLLLGIIIFLLYSKQITLNSYVIAGLISVGIAMIAMYFGALKIFGWMAPKWDPKQFKKLIKDSFPFAVITILYSVNDKVDQVMLERMDGSHEAGLYVGAYRWVDATMMFLWTVLPIFFARFAFHIDSPEKQQNLLKFGQGIASLPMLFVAMFAWFYGDQLLFLFDQSTDAELRVMTACVWILFLSVAVNGVFAIFSTLLTSTGHEKFVSWMIAISIVINIALNAIFIPKYGAIASAWTTLISYSFLSISYVVYIEWKLPFGLSWKLLGKVAICAFIAFFTMMFLEKGKVPWIATTITGGVILFALGFLLKVISVGGKEEV